MAELSISQVNTRIDDRIEESIPEIINLVYPLGSYYYTDDKDFNPNKSFGGTWEPVKDKFILAAGDSYNQGDEGGEATHTLTIEELPSHTHVFTGSQVTTGNESVGHTHTFSTGTESQGHTHTFSTGTESATHSHSFTTGGMNSNATHKHEFTDDSNSPAPVSGSGCGEWSAAGSGGGGWWRWTTEANIDHTHSGSTGTESAHHTHSGTTNGISAHHTHSGTTNGISTDHTHNVTASGSNSNTGSGAEINNMPPYIVAYCWHRIK